MRVHVAHREKRDGLRRLINLDFRQASSIQVRFFIRGQSGSLRLRFPKIIYKKQLETPEEQAIVFYRLADATVSAILDADYYTHQRRSLEELSIDLCMFPEMVELTSFREVLTSAEARRTFLLDIDVGEQWQKWSPHLQALDELLLSNVIEVHVKEVLGELVSRDPGMTARLLAACQTDPKKHRMGALAAIALAGELQAIPTELRSKVEEILLSWAIDREQDSWDVNVDTDEFSALNLKWRVEDISFDVFPIIIWKLVGVLHARLKTCTGEVSPLLRKFNWCMTAAKGLPVHHSKSPAALWIVSTGRVPKSVAEADLVLEKPVADLHALDDAVLDQYGLSLWPFLTASRRDANVKLSNDGMGMALAVEVHSVETSPSIDTEPSAFDLIPGASALLPLSDGLAVIDVHFEKLGRTYQVALPIAEEASSTVNWGSILTLPLVISRKRLAARRNYRKTIDPQGIVVGASPALFEVFEHIHHANVMEELPSVLILGEPGVGKTHIAKLLHDSSSCLSRPFKVVNAGGGGGDINIQRGEWIGYGKGHGIHGIDKNGRAGHLMNANGGTLFIDEFATLSSNMQVIFLSVLEKRSIEKIGGESFTPDVRCILATNADVEEAVTNGTLRCDLLDRIPIKFHVPPLRERRGDILLLAKHFALEGITDQCLVALLRYHWPSNVRELKNKIATAIARKKSEQAAAIDLTHIELPADLVSAVDALDDDACRRELWTVADEIARDEGFEHDTGLQRRAGKIMGVSEPQTSKMYQAFGLTSAASA